MLRSLSSVKNLTSNSSTEKKAPTCSNSKVSSNMTARAWSGRIWLRFLFQQCLWDKSTRTETWESPQAAKTTDSTSYVAHPAPNTTGPYDDNCVGYGDAVILLSVGNSFQALQRSQLPHSEICRDRGRRHSIVSPSPRSNTSPHDSSAYSIPHSSTCSNPHASTYSFANGRPDHRPDSHHALDFTS